METIQQKRKDLPAIQQQIAAENVARIEHKVDLQRINDRYAVKKEEIQHLQQKEIELTNKNNDLDIENVVLQKWNLSPEKKNVKARVITASKMNVQLTADNEVLQEGVKVDKATQKQEIWNKVLRAIEQAFNNILEDPQVQEDIDDLVEKETKLKELQKEGENIELLHKKDEQLN